MENNRIKTIAILGGDCVAWSVAAILLRCSGIKSLRVVVIDAGGSVPAGEIKAMNPSLQKFHNLIGIDEKDFMLKTGASFRLANRYAYDNDDQQQFILSFSDHGARFDDVDFHQHFIKHSEGSVAQTYHSYSLGAVAAIKEKFARPATDPSSIYSSFSYGYHLDSRRYSDYLREWVLTWGGERIPGVYNGFTACPETGFLRAIILDNDRQLDADFFVDCSGAAGSLIGKSLNVPYEDFSKYLPVKYYTDITIASDFHSKLSTLWGYKENIWKKEVSLDGLCYFRFFSSSSLDNKKIAEEVKHGEVDSDFEEKTLNPGLRKFVWYKNCLSVGASCGYLGEFGVNDLELSHFIAIKFLDFFPDAHCRPFNTAEFNRAITRECENIRDFNTLHYFMARRMAPYQHEPAVLSLSSELGDSLDLFADCGIRTGINDNLISRQQWISYLMEHKFFPRQSILLASFSCEELMRRFAYLGDSIERATNAMPDHKEYVARYLPNRRI